MSSRFRARAVLIDLDGTLVDSLPDIACAANSMRADLGLLPLALKRIAAYVGKGIDVLVHRALTETMDDQAAARSFRTRQASVQSLLWRVNGNESRCMPAFSRRWKTCSKRQSRLLA